MAANVEDAENEFTITRVFHASRDLVYKAWTECEHLKHWWGPKGFTVSYCKNDLRPGGMLHYCLKSPDGQDMWGKFAYREIVAPERLVYINSFSDEKGGTARHPLHQEWPLEILSTVTFSEQHGLTTVTVHWVPINATEGERKTFSSGHGSMQQGWTGTLDHLATYLATSGE